MKSITTVIYTYNEEKNIKICIESVRQLTDNIIVIDSESTDKTVEIAKKEGAQVCALPYSTYVEPAREFGIKKAETGWVFILDADERITPELASEIKSALHNPKFSHYKIPRKNIFGKKKWLKHGGWWPDSQIRLINKRFFKTWPKEIHSTPVIDGQHGLLAQPFIHYFHGDFEQMVSKTVTFENIESDLLLKAGKKANTVIFFRKFMGELCRRLLKKAGFLDGQIGIIEAIYQAFSKTITYLFLYEKKKSRSV